jgi:hypothetical protein
MGKRRRCDSLVAWGEAQRNPRHKRPMVIASGAGSIVRAGEKMPEGGVRDIDGLKIRQFFVSGFQPQSPMLFPISFFPSFCLDAKGPKGQDLPKLHPHVAERRPAGKSSHRAYHTEDSAQRESIPDDKMPPTVGMTAKTKQWEPIREWVSAVGAEVCWSFTPFQSIPNRKT